MLFEKGAVLSDFDGTFVDSFREGVRTFRIVAKKMRIRIPYQQEFKEHWGLKWETFMEKIWPRVNVERFNDVFEKCGFYDEPIPAFPGVDEALLFLQQQGYFLGLITNRDRITLKKCAENVGIRLDVFHFIQAVGDTPFHKPDPRVFDEVLAKISGMNIQGRMVYVGDTLKDCQATKGTPIEFVAVLTGPTSREEFVAAGVREENILGSFKDLPQFL